MTALQTKKYWREWAKVRRMLVEVGEFSKADADAERKEIHFEALGKAKSSKDFTNKDFDAILKQFELRLVVMSGPVSGDREVEQPIKRLIFAIDQLGLDAPYIAAISLAQFKTAEWRFLDEAQLTRFRMTLTRRARAKNRRTAADAETSDPF